MCTEFPLIPKFIVPSCFCWRYSNRKFYVSKKESFGTPGSSDEGARVILGPVTGGSDENKDFFKYTPNGQIVLETINPAAAALFSEGSEFYVDFTPAPKAS